MEEETKVVKETWKEKVSKKQKVVVDWCGKHVKEICVFGPPLIGFACEVVKSTMKHQNVKGEKMLKKRMIYDRSAGHYCETKRDLTGKDWLIIDERHDNGESYSKILDEMGLLK